MSKIGEMMDEKPLVGRDTPRFKATEELWRILKVVERGEPISWMEAEWCVDRIAKILT